MSVSLTFHEEILALVDRINAEKMAIKKLPLAEELRRLLAEEKGCATRA